jgi:hypothetical protein
MTIGGYIGFVLLNAAMVLTYLLRCLAHGLFIGQIVMRSL